MIAGRDATVASIKRTNGNEEKAVLLLLQLPVARRVVAILRDPRLLRLGAIDLDSISASRTNVVRAAMRAAHLTTFDFTPKVGIDTDGATLAAQTPLKKKQRLGCGASGQTLPPFPFTEISGKSAAAALKQACSAGDAKAVEMICAAKLHTLDLCQPDRLGMTLLHHAVRQRDTDVAKLLLEADAAPDSRCLQGETPLHNAIAAAVETFTPRTHAMVSLLLTHDADPLATTAAGATCLILSAGNATLLIELAKAQRGKDERVSEGQRLRDGERLKVLEVALSHDQWEPASDRSTLWPELLDVLQRRPDLRSPLVIPDDEQKAWDQRQATMNVGAFSQKSIGLPPAEAPDSTKKKLADLLAASEVEDESELDTAKLSSLAESLRTSRCETPRPPSALPLLCGLGHEVSLEPHTRESNYCDICGKTGTAYRCNSGCDYDVCSSCWDKNVATRVRHYLNTPAAAPADVPMTAAVPVDADEDNEDNEDEELYTCFGCGEDFPIDQLEDDRCDVIVTMNPNRGPITLTLTLNPNPNPNPNSNPNPNPNSKQDCQEGCCDSCEQVFRMDELDEDCLCDACGSQATCVDCDEIFDRGDHCKCCPFVCEVLQRP